MDLNGIMAAGPLGGVVSGVVSKTTSDKRSISAASALAQALKAENIESFATTGLPFADSTPKFTPRPDDPATFMVLIVVGNKP